MEKQEIISGLRNAIDRGYTLDLAVQSFMNAGYSQQDVIDSAKVLGYNSSIISKSPIMTQIQQTFPQQPQQLPQSLPQQQMQSQPLPQTKSLAQISQAVKQPELPSIPLPSIQPPQKPVQINISDNDIRKQRSFLAENWIIILLSILLLLLLAGLSLSIFAQDIVLSFLRSLGINLG